MARPILPGEINALKTQLIKLVAELDAASAAVTVKGPVVIILDDKTICYSGWETVSFSLVLGYKQQNF